MAITAESIAEAGRTELGRVCMDTQLRLNVIESADPDELIPGQLESAQLNYAMAHGLERGQVRGNLFTPVQEELARDPEDEICTHVLREIGVREDIIACFHSLMAEGRYRDFPETGVANIWNYAQHVINYRAIYRIQTTDEAREDVHTLYQQAMVEFLEAAYRGRDAVVVSEEAHEAFDGVRDIPEASLEVALSVTSPYLESLGQSEDTYDRANTAAIVERFGNEPMVQEELITYTRMLLSEGVPMAHIVLLRAHAEQLFARTYAHLVIHHLEGSSLARETMQYVVQSELRQVAQVYAEQPMTFGALEENGRALEALQAQRAKLNSGKDAAAIALIDARIARRQAQAEAMRGFVVAGMNESETAPEPVPLHLSYHLAPTPAEQTYWWQIAQKLGVRLTPDTIAEGMASLHITQQYEAMTDAVAAFQADRTRVQRGDMSDESMSAYEASRQRLFDAFVQLQGTVVVRSMHSADARRYRASA